MPRCPATMGRFVAVSDTSFDDRLLAFLRYIMDVAVVISMAMRDFNGGRFISQTVTCVRTECIVRPGASGDQRWSSR